jgi:hypothetical protein
MMSKEGGKGNPAPADVVPEPAEPVVAVYVSKMIKPSILEDQKEKARLRENLTRWGVVA